MVYERLHALLLRKTEFRGISCSHALTGQDRRRRDSLPRTRSQVGPPYCLWPVSAQPHRQVNRHPLPLRSLAQPVPRRRTQFSCVRRDQNRFCPPCFFPSFNRSRPSPQGTATGQDCQTATPDKVNQTLAIVPSHVQPILFDFRLKFKLTPRCQEGVATGWCVR